MSAIISVTQHALSTVAENTQVQAQNAAIMAANSTDVNATVNRIAETIGTLNSPREDGEKNTLKSINIEQANMDVRLSQAELIVYDGELSSVNIKLQGVRSELVTAKQAALLAEEAKTQIKTSINADGNAEFVTHSGIKIVTDTNKGGDQTWIYNPAGEQIMHIHGDPHVNMLKDADGNNGDDFHFGDDSTLKFEDGTELTFNTTENGKDTGIFYTTGIYVKAGNNVMHTGEATSGGARRADIAKVDAKSYSQNGSTAKGAVTMGLKGDGQILMQTRDQKDLSLKWHELKDESWDDYLKDKTFNNQKGALVDFKPQTIGGNKREKSEIIINLETEEAALVSRISALTQLKSRAESNLDTANSALTEFSAMADSEFVDNEENRKNAEKKSLELSKRSNDLGIIMAKSSLVGAGDLAYSGLKTQADMITDSTAANRELRSIEFDFKDQGLENTAGRNDDTDDLIDTLTALAEVGSFEEKSLEGDELPKHILTQGMTSFKDKFISLSESVSAGTTSIHSAQEQLKIQTDALLVSIDKITMDYEDFVSPSRDGLENPVILLAQMNSFQDINKNAVLDLEQQLSAAQKDNTDAGRLAANQLSDKLTTATNLLTLTNDSASFMGKLADKVQIDFGDMSPNQAKEFYNSQLNSLIDLEDQQYIDLEDQKPTDDARISINLTRHVVKELERQFKFKKIDVFPNNERHPESINHLRVNQDMLKVQENQLEETSALDTEAEAALRNQIGITQNMIAFWTETAKFWNSNSGQQKKAS